MNGKRILAIGLGLAAAAMLAGCFDSNIPPPLPALFRIDEIRYWWEDNDLIVNVTFTNTHPTHTPGDGALDPHISILLIQQEITNNRGRPGQDTEPAYGTEGNRNVDLNFGTEYGNAWQKRWYRSGITGPMLIPPGTTLSVEFGLKPDFQYTSTDDGYYYLNVDMTYWYPRTFYTAEHQDEEDASYYTGCFNRVVPEFYGVKNGGADCGLWDCTGERTENGYEMQDLRGTYRPTCDATIHTGPNYK